MIMNLAIGSGFVSASRSHSGIPSSGDELACSCILNGSTHGCRKSYETHVQQGFQLNFIIASFRRIRSLDACSFCFSFAVATQRPFHWLQGPALELFGMAEAAG